MSQTTTDSWMAGMDKALRAKLDACRVRLRELGRVVVAFSSGVDSTFLLALAADVLGKENVLAAMGISPSVPGRPLGSRAFVEKLEALLGRKLLPGNPGRPKKARK